MAHVADNAAILHLVHVVAGYHVLVPSCRDHYINTLDYLCQFHNLSEKQIMVPEQNILDDGCDSHTQSHCTAKYATCYLKTIHASLERTDRVNLGDIDDTPITYTYKLFISTQLFPDFSSTTPEEKWKSGRWSPGKDGGEAFIFEQ